MRFPLLAGLLLSSLAALAQPDPIKFGKPDAQDFAPASFVADSAAGAVVLCDYGRSRLEGFQTSFRVVFERVTRLKILKKSGYDAATVEIPLYHENNNSEQVRNLRGNTYHLVSGKVQTTPLASTAVFLEKRSDRVNVQKFTLPDVREGAVVEYAYTVVSDYLFNFQDWTFQSEYPTRWSEYRSSIPVFFKYKIIYQGFRPPDVSKASTGMVSLQVDHQLGNGAGLMTGHTVGTLHISSPTEVHQWAMKNVEPFREEPYMTTARDYLARLDFELTGEQWPEQDYRDLTGSWEKINKKLLESEDFGQQLQRSTPLKAQMQQLAAQYPGLPERAAAVRAAVLNAVRYDGTNRYTTESLRRAYDNHRGSAADVNLLLVAALREAGLPAQPVLLSTRDHGHINREFPLLDRFNYVVASLPVAEDQDLLLDATEPLLPSGTLPPRCLNQTGRLIGPTLAESRWINLRPAQKHTSYCQAQLTLTAQGELRGTVHEERGGYAAATERAEIMQLSEKKYQARLAQQHTDWTLPKFAVANLEAPDRVLGLDYEFTQPVAAPAADGSLYLSPLALFHEQGNPFRHESRQYPVDMGTALNETTMVTLALPAGYELAGTPAPLVLDLPDSGGRYVYQATAAGDKIQLTSRLILQKPLYSADEYPNLRELYRRLREKQAEPLVLRKKA